MIRLRLIKLLINLFDYFQQKKVYNFLKKKINSGAVLFDVGAHHGETIKKFVKYFNYLSIHSFEASIKNYQKGLIIVIKETYLSIILVFQT